MAQSLDEQINTVERALGECMIEHALVVVRTWLNELGEGNHFEEAFRAIETQYQRIFQLWLTSDEESNDIALNKLTGDTYQLVDAVYVEIRLKRGLSPRMHGFNPESPQSLIQYFSNCVQLQQQDFDWLREAMRDEARVGMALVAITALVRNMRECFSLDGILTLIDGFDAENDIVADQCLANTLTLLIHYDIRMDFFPQLQEAFGNAIADMGDGGNHAFEVLCALIKSSRADWLESYAVGEMALSDLPKELQKLVDATGIKDDYKTFYSWVPKSESEYMAGLVQIFPQTWLYDIMIKGVPEFERNLAYVYLSIGNRELMWDFPDVGEQWYVNVLRKGSNQPADYVNYAHCLMLKGDRMMAFETYRQARQMCESSKDFLALFRPDRRNLVEHGVLLEHVYLIEDQMLAG